MITVKDKLFVLDTERTTYAFRIMPSGHLEHLYYGRKIHLDSEDGLYEQWEFAPGNSSIYDEENKNISLEDIKLEVSAPGKGDVREPSLELVNTDGSFTSDFVYEKHEISKGRERDNVLPVAYGDEADVLKVILNDRENDITLTLIYTVFEECDVIMIPTAPKVAFKFGAHDASPLEMYLEDIYTVPVNIAGLPGISIPGGFGENDMPIGIQFIANAFDEMNLLQVAYTFEQNTPYHNEVPTMRGGKN